MKKLLLFIVLLVSFLHAYTVTGTVAAPTQNADVGRWEKTSLSRVAAVTDTLNGDDTLSLFSGTTSMTIEPGYEYALRMKLTTTTADSMKWQYISYGLNDTIMETTVFDTTGASLSYVVLGLPFNKTILANKVDIRCIGWTAAKKRSFHVIEVWRKAISWNVKNILQ